MLEKYKKCKKIILHNYIFFVKYKCANKCNYNNSYVTIYFMRRKFNIYIYL